MVFIHIFFLCCFFLLLQVRRREIHINFSVKNAGAHAAVKHLSILVIALVNFLPKNVISLVLLASLLVISIFKVTVVVFVQYHLWSIKALTRLNIFKFKSRKSTFLNYCATRFGPKFLDMNKMPNEMFFLSKIDFKSFCGVTCRTLRCFYEVHWSLPRCRDQFSTFGQYLSRACRISLPIVHFISNIIEKEKKSRMNIRCYSMLLDIDVTDLLGLNF